MLSLDTQTRSGVTSPDYGRLSDDDLRSIASVDAENLTPEARQALANELARRSLHVATALPRPHSELVQPPTTTTGEWRYPKARIGARILAYIIDSLVATIPSAFVIGLGVAVLARRNGNSPGILIVILLGVLWWLYYSFAKDGWTGGQSLGKKAMDLMVVDVRTNQPCTVGQSALRALILFVLSFVMGLGWLIELIVILASQNGRRLGDLAAGTQVIDTSAYRPSA